MGGETMKSNITKKIINFEKVNEESLKQTKVTLEKIIKNEMRSSPVCEVVDTFIINIFNQMCKTYSFEHVVEEIKLNTLLIYNSIDAFLEYVCIHIIKDFHIEYHIIDDIIDIIQHHFNINVLQVNFFRRPHHYKTSFINLNANEQKIISVQSFNKLVYTYITYYDKIDLITSNAIYHFIELIIRLFMKYNYVIQFTNKDLINLNALSSLSRISIFHKYNKKYNKKIIKLIKLYKKFNKFCLSYNWIL